MRCSVHAQNWSATFSSKDLYLIDKVAAMGFDGIEIPLVASVVTELPIAEAKRRLSGCGISPSFDTGLDADQNISSENAQYRTKGMDHLKR